MSFASLLVHPLAVVTPYVPDEDDVDERGFPLPGPDIVELVNGMVQPRRTAASGEVAASHQGGVEISTHVIFLLPMTIGTGAWIRDHPDTGRRFDIDLVRSLEFGSVPHLELDCHLVGSTEGPGVPAGS